jgi:hypothetical protein
MNEGMWHSGLEVNFNFFLASVEQYRENRKSDKKPRGE